MPLILAENTKDIDSLDDFKDFFTPDNADKPSIHGGFARMHWAGSPEDEDRIAKDHTVTVRCIPLGQDEPGTCPFTGKPSQKRVILAKAY